VTPGDADFGADAAGCCLDRDLAGLDAANGATDEASQLAPHGAGLLGDGVEESSVGVPVDCQPAVLVTDVVADLVEQNGLADSAGPTTRVMNS
jgi:hypothetical protein